MASAVGSLHQNPRGGKGCGNLGHRKRGVSEGLSGRVEIQACSSGRPTSASAVHIWWFIASSCGYLHPSFCVLRRPPTTVVSLGDGSLTYSCFALFASLPFAGQSSTSAFLLLVFHRQSTLPPLLVSTPLGRHLVQPFSGSPYPTALPRPDALAPGHHGRPNTLMHIL